MDGALVKAVFGKRYWINPTDRGKSDAKYFVLMDGYSISLAIVVASTNRHDMQRFEATLEGV
jgi:hypothetical protein